MKIKLNNYVRQLWLSLLLLVGVAAIAVPGLNGTNSGGVAKIGDTEYETLQAAIDAAGTGTTKTSITLFANTTENVVIAAGQNIELTINSGVTLSGGGNPNFKAAINNEGTLTIKKGSGTAAATIKREDTAAANGDGQAAYYVILNNGTMSISGVTVTNDSGPSAEGGLWSGSSLICNGTTNTSPSLTISGGTYTQNNFIVIKNDDYGTLKITGGTFNTNNQAVQNWNTTTITSGTFNGNVYSWAWVGNGAQPNPTITISGGTFNNCEVGTSFYGTPSSNISELNISGGTFNNCSLDKADGSELTITGGTFIGGTNPTSYGYEALSLEVDGQTVVTDKSVQYTSLSGEVSFRDLTGNFDKEGTYKLLKPITRTSNMAVSSGIYKVTLDLNGYTLTSTPPRNAGIYLTQVSTPPTSQYEFNIISSRTGGSLIVTNDLPALLVTGNYYHLTIGKDVKIQDGDVFLQGKNQILSVDGVVEGCVAIV